MANINITVAGRELQVADGYEKPSAGDVNTCSVSISLDSAWDAFPGKRVTFSSRTASVTVDYAEEMQIPWEVMRNKGALYVGVTGYDMDGNELMRTHKQTYPLEIAAPSDDEGATPSPATLDVVSRVDALAQRLESSEDAREATFQASETNREDTFQATQAARSASFASAQQGRAAEFGSKMVEWGQAVDSKVSQASSAIDTANAAASSADSKAAIATAAAENASEKASLAASKAVEAESAAAAANAAKQAADTASATANAAAATATAAAGNAQGVADTVQAKLDAGEFKGEKGDKGDPGEVSMKQLEPIERRLDNLEAAAGILYREESDSEEAYEKQVPSGALPWAKVESFGGHTVSWNQLMGTTPDKYRVASYSVSYNDGTFTLTNPNNYAHSWARFGSFDSFPSGHKVYVSCVLRSSFTPGNPVRFAFSDNSLSVYSVIANAVTLSANTDASFSAIGTSPQASYGNSFVYMLHALSSNDGFTANETLKLKDFFIIDLTQRFGAGNEPTSVDDPRIEWVKRYAEEHPEYNPGELVSAEVERVESVGKNLLNITATFPYTASGFTYTKNGNAITASGAATSWPFMVIGEFAAKKDDVFYLSFNRDSASISVRFVEKNTVNILPISHDGRCVIPKDMTVRVDIQIGDNKTSGTFTISNIQVERGSVVTEYKPYREPISYPIPEAVRQLPGYGWSAGSAYNEVDWERKVYVQRVKSVDLGTKSFVRYQEIEHMFILNVPDASKNVAKAVCNAYMWRYWEPLGTLPNMGFQTHPTLSYMYFRNDACNTDSEMKTAMQGVLLYYELSEPIETDISDIIGDNAINVEPNGSIVFENAAKLDVPNSIGYVIGTGVE